jgi:hypothetical protein
MDIDPDAMWNAIALIMQQLHAEYPLGAIFEYASEVRYCRNGRWLDVDLIPASQHPKISRSGLAGFVQVGRCRPLFVR